MAGGSILYDSNNYGANPLTIVHSQLRGITESFTGVFVTGTVVAFTNTLLERSHEFGREQQQNRPDYGLSDRSTREFLLPDQRNQFIHANRRRQPKRDQRRALSFHRPGRSNQGGLSHRYRLPLRGAQRKQ